MRLAILALWGVLLETGGPQSASPVPPPERPSRAGALPDNPCEVLTVAQVAALTGLDVIQARRVPSISKKVEAQREDRAPGPGAICAYETRSEFGEIAVFVPPRVERGAARYGEARERYFRSFSGSAQVVPRLGQDAWIAGGASLYVLTREDEYFVLSTQMYQERSRALLIGLARGVLDRR